jgi:hypothetical protein
VGAGGDLVKTCQNRLLEGNLVARWVAGTLLGTSKPVVISGLPFLMGEVRAGQRAGQDAVGKMARCW